MARNSTALVQTFEKGLQLLEYLVEHKVVSVTSIAKLMGIQKSASYRFLNTLRLHGYVEQDQHNNYILTDKVSKMGNGIVPRMEFRHIVSRFLDELAKRNCKDGICNLGKWNGKEIVYEVQSANFEYAQYSVGRTVPAYCSALGKAILAHLPLKGLAVPLLSGDGRIKYAISATRTQYGPIDSLIEDMLVPLQETAHDIVEYIKFYHFD